MEKDNEVYGTSGTSYTTEFRQYEPRLGRWFSVDPKVSRAPNLTPYRFGFNNPIVVNDPNGDYEADGSLSKKEKKEIRSEFKAKGDKNWRKKANVEIANKVAQNVKIIETKIEAAKNLLESNSQAAGAFEALTGTKKGDENYRDFFVNNGKGPKVKIGDLDESGSTSPSGDVTISSKGHSDLSLSVTILHEYIHSASNRGLITGDNTTAGYQNLFVNGRQIPLLEQLNVLTVASQSIKPSLIPLFNTYYPNKNIVEGGYLFEVLGFEKITNQPLKAK